MVTSCSLYLCVRCGACSKGWFDLGGPAWRALTNNMAPGHVYGVKSRWVTCPNNLSSGNIHVYVKPGSHAWDARFQVTKISVFFNKFVNVKVGVVVWLRIETFFMLFIIYNLFFQNTP